MKKLLIILLILLSFDYSNQITKLPDKFIPVLKCVFSSVDRINSLTTIVETVFKSSSTFDWFFCLPTLINIAEECFEIDLAEIINQFINNQIVFQNQKETILKKVQTANAPLLLRKYLYDTTIKNDIFKAKRECEEMTLMVPYDKYKNICELFSF